MKKLAFSSIQASLTFWFLFLALLPLLVGMIISYRESSKALELKTYDKLTAIRDLKVGQLESWIAERSGDLNGITSDFDLMALKEYFNDPKSTIKSNKLKEDALNVLNYHLNKRITYNEIFVINAKTGTVEISTNHSYEGVNKRGESYFYEPLKTRNLYIKDIYHSLETGNNTMDFAQPLHETPDKNSEIIGIVVLRVDLQNSLYSLLLNRTGLGKTGETLIVNKDVIALNELRWYASAPLKLQIVAEPAINSSQGKTGIIRGKDYRGEEVLAAFTYIPETGWGFVCKQDWAELNAPVNLIGLKLIVLFIISSMAIVLVSIYISKSISKPIVKMNLVSKKFGAGDFKVRNPVESDNELGSLASELNNMADITESRLKIQQGVSDISETMIGKSGIQEFGKSLLKRLMKITDANMSTFYILNEAIMEYEHFASVGANEEMLRPFSAEHPQGEFGNALSTKNIFHLQNIPSDTTFRFKTVVGEAVPKEIITIPIIVDESIVAIISLVNIQKFGKESMEILQQSWVSINTSYSNLIASERTRVLAEHLGKINQQLEAQSEELQDQAEELQDQAAELQYTSDELQEQNIELEAQRKQVEAANKLKSEFLSNMSHELRTPLNSIMALSRVLIMQASNKLNADEKNYLEIVERNGKRLLALINDILDLSKIEAGKMEILPKSFSIPLFLQTLKENIQGLSEEKGLSLTLNLSDKLPLLESDESRLHQVLTNIMGNAVKFTEKGGVTVSAESNNEKVFITVQDTGIGISEENLPTIFDEFVQVDGTSSRQYEGTGLGLAIAKKMMNILGGNIEVESELGKGAAFTVTIPIKWHEELLLRDSFNSEDSSSSSLANTILVVDDDKKTVKRISEYLNEAGYKTITATTGKEALKLADRYQPFAITLDIIMEDMDGWEVMQKLKNNIKTRDIPVIIVSVSNDKETGFALGAVGFVNKPVNKQVLISQIRDINKTPKSVMIVDDNIFELEQMSKIIEAEKIKTYKATGGKECIKLLDDKKPDVLILDLIMPDMDGFMVLDEIRKKKETQNLPVIIVTAKDLSKEEKIRLSGNVSALIEKSDANPQHLLNEIKRIIIELEKTKQVDILGDKNSQIRILMVEDNQDAIVQVKAVLERENYNIDVAHGGQEALDYIQHTIPDGIILDLMMPEIDGFGVLEKLRNTEKTKKTPVLILTAKDLTRKDLAKLSANNIQQLIHKGDVDIEGLLFKIKLMLGNEPKQNLKTTPISIPNHLKKEENQQPATSNQQPITNLPNLLIVEDNLDNMTTIRAILKGKFNISEAYDGEIGLKKAQSEKPDLILLDMSLPKVSGPKMIKTLKSQDHTINIPLIAVTAQAMKGDMEYFLKSGCDGYVSKPIDHLNLTNEIERLLKREIK